MDDHCTSLDIAADAVLFLNNKITCFDATTRKFSAVDQSEANSVACARLINSYASLLRIIKFGIVVGSAELSFWDYPNQSQSHNLLNELAPSTRESLTVFLDTLPRIVNIIDTRSATTVKDSSFKQIKKDIERDSIVVNSICLRGSVVGVDFIKCAIRDYISSLVHDANLARLPSFVIEGLCHSILQASSRTNCGGAVFEALIRVLDTASALIVPIALKSTPATVHISFGRSFEASESNEQEWGLLVSVKCSTAFSVSEVSQSEITDLHISGTYTCVLFLKLYLPQEIFPETERCKTIYEKAIFDRIVSTPS